jgi:hypothetical protein
LSCLTTSGTARRFAAAQMAELCVVASESGWRFTSLPSNRWRVASLRRRRMALRLVASETVGVWRRCVRGTARYRARSFGRSGGIAQVFGRSSEASEVDVCGLALLGAWGHDEAVARVADGADEQAASLRRPWQARKGVRQIGSFCLADWKATLRQVGRCTGGRGQQTLPFGPKLRAMPISALWELAP